MSDYNRRTWEDGELITAEKLNNMETGIVEAKKEAEGRAPKDSPEFKGSVSLGRKAGTAVGEGSFAVGHEVEASGYVSHAEGDGTSAKGHYSHAEGKGSEALADWSHAEGISHATGKAAHAEGRGTTASAEVAHAEGAASVASGYASHAEGHTSLAEGDYSHAQGYHTIANGRYSHAMGKHNKRMQDDPMESALSTDDALAIGNGIGDNDNERSNAFRVTFGGSVYGLSAFNASGADYAEFFEWLDGNADAEDRIGHFVTLDGDKIVKAKAGDYILGIVSGNPCIVGNSDEDWLGRWEKDEFGRLLTEKVTITDEETGETFDVLHYKQNPDYDGSQKYIERKKRQEWDYIGMLGVLAVRDDGTCQVNGFCKVADDGTATAAGGYVEGQSYRVIARVTEDVVKIVFR